MPPRPLGAAESSGQVVALVVVQCEIEAFFLAFGSDPGVDVAR